MDFFSVYLALSFALSCTWGYTRYSANKPIRTQAVGSIALATILVGEAWPKASLAAWFQIIACILGLIAVALGVTEWRKEHPTHTNPPL